MSPCTDSHLTGHPCDPPAVPIVLSTHTHDSSLDSTVLVKEFSLRSHIKVSFLADWARFIITMIGEMQALFSTAKGVVEIPGTYLHL